MAEQALSILEMVSNAGAARNAYIEAIAEVKSKNYERCNELVAQGNELYVKAHRMHTSMLHHVSSEQEFQATLLMTHGQDILMSAECFKILCDEFIDLYRRIDELEKQS